MIYNNDKLEVNINIRFVVLFFLGKLNNFLKQHRISKSRSRTNRIYLLFILVIRNVIDFTKYFKLVEGCLYNSKKRIKKYHNWLIYKDQVILDINMLNNMLYNKGKYDPDYKYSTDENSLLSLYLNRFENTFNGEISLFEEMNIDIDSIKLFQYEESLISNIISSMHNAQIINSYHNFHNMINFIISDSLLKFNNTFQELQLNFDDKIEITEMINLITRSSLISNQNTLCQYTFDNISELYLMAIIFVIIHIKDKCPWYYNRLDEKFFRLYINNNNNLLNHINHDELCCDHCNIYKPKSILNWIEKNLKHLKNKIV